MHLISVSFSALADFFSSRDDMQTGIFPARCELASHQEKKEAGLMSFLTQAAASPPTCILKMNLVTSPCSFSIMSLNMLVASNLYSEKGSRWP